tara:strand:+ start:1799 stop:3478 length:1680 start_codon:yes stop_codon:yes gene_type:complete
MQHFKKDKKSKSNQNFISKQKKLFLFVKNNQDFYLNKVNSYLSDLNVLNSNYLWWAFNFSSKSPLNTTVVTKIIDVLAVLDLERDGIFNPEDYKKFSNAQKKILFQYFSTGNEVMLFFLNFFISFFTRVLNFFKVIIRLIQVFIFFSFKKTYENQHKILLFTFIDGTNRKINDPYFGNLKNLIEKQNSNTSIGYLYYLYRPFYKMSKILKNEKAPHHYIFSYLKIQDYLWCFIQIIKIYFFKIKKIDFKYNSQSILLHKIIRENMIEEIPRGIIENLLLFKAFRRLNSNRFLEKIIYPFENKPMEKFLSLGLSNKIKKIGYQHTSITPSHLSFQFSKTEINKTPLPDKIVTVGKITKNWLIKRCNFPPKKIIQGVALRTFQNKPLVRDFFAADNAKLLFVFSSSKDEIIKTIKLLKEIPIKYNFKYKFRFHPNFPITVLDRLSQNWIKKKVHFISRNTLHEEFKWADIMVYISSSASIESLLCSLPVIRLDIDKFNFDPFLNHKTPLKKEVKSSKDFIKSIFELSNLTKNKRKIMELDSKKFAESYMVPIKKFNFKMFY